STRKAFHDRMCAPCSVKASSTGAAAPNPMKTRGMKPPATGSRLTESMNRGPLRAEQDAAEHQLRGDRGCRSDEAPLGRLSRPRDDLRISRRSAQSTRPQLDGGALLAMRDLLFHVHRSGTDAAGGAAQRR